MNIALRDATKVVLFALLLAGMLMMISQGVYATREPFQIKPNTENGCWQIEGGSRKCCVDSSGPECEWKDKTYQECGDEIGKPLCAANEISKIQDFYGPDYCAGICPWHWPY